MALYSKNRLTVSRKVHYSLKNKNSFDLVLGLNGLPIATVELKIFLPVKLLRTQKGNIRIHGLKLSGSFCIFRLTKQRTMPQGRNIKEKP